MNYRHAFHAGNFADVHKHVALLALLAALLRKPKSLLFLDTHSGAGLYRLSGAAARRTREADLGIGRLESAQVEAPEIRDYLALVAEVRAELADPSVYPGSTLLAARRLRPGDRLVAVELDPIEAGVLDSTLGADPRLRIERGDGFERLKAHLPPVERRGLILIDPPYEETTGDFTRVGAALAEGLRRFATGVFCVWYPIKLRSETDRWLAALATRLPREMLRAELWLYPPDSPASLNGSGLLLVNPPWQVADRMRVWLPELGALLAARAGGGTCIESLNARPARV